MVRRYAGLRGAGLPDASEWNRRTPRNPLYAMQFAHARARRVLRLCEIDGDVASARVPPTLADPIQVALTDAGSSRQVWLRGGPTHRYVRRLEVVTARYLRIDPDGVLQCPEGVPLVGLSRQVAGVLASGLGEFGLPATELI